METEIGWWLAGQGEGLESRFSVYTTAFYFLSDGLFFATMQAISPQTEFTKYLGLK